MAYRTLDEALRTMAESVRSYLRARDVGRSMTLTITISGEVQAGSLLVEYKADHANNYDSAVPGRTMNDAVQELCRRMDWKVEHAPMLLEGPAEPPSAAATDGV